MHFRTETISKYPNSWLEYSSPQIEKGFSGMRNCCCGVRSADRKQGTIGGRRSLRRGSFAEAPSLSRNAEMKLKPNLIRLAQEGPCTCKIRKWNKVSHCNGQPPLKWTHQGGGCINSYWFPTADHYAYISRLLWKPVFLVVEEELDFREKKTISDTKTKAEKAGRRRIIAIVDILDVNNGGLLI